jgi:hypothetical protein
MMKQTLKDKYEVLQKKYSLPLFTELNAFFDIENVDKETSKFIRDIRKAMTEKVLDQLRLIETLLNPTNVSPMFLQFVKKVTYDERTLFTYVYKKLVALELQDIALEVEAYNEEKEAQAISHIYKTWEELLPSWKTIVGVMKNNVEGTNSRHERNYF